MKQETNGSLTITGQITSIVSPNGNAWAYGRIRIDQNCLAVLRDPLQSSSSPDFLPRELRPASRDISFAGFLDAAYIAGGSRAHLRGEFVLNPKYGLQFQVTSADLDRGIESGGLANWIANQNNLPGLGQVRARKLVEEFGDRLSDEIATPEQRRKLASFFRVPETTLERLHVLLTEDSALLSIRTWLASLEITEGQSKKLVEKYGLDTRRILEQNPYQMIDDIEGFGFFRADQIAKKTGLPEDSPGRLRAGIVYVLQQDCEQNGNTWMMVTHLVDETNKMLAMNTIDAKERIRAAVQALRDGENGKAKIVEIDGRIGLAWLHEMERYAVDLIAEFSEAPGIKNGSEIYAAADTGRLNADQRSAFFAALTNRISIITGGAGTGKTFLIKEIASAFKNAGLHVVLCAPTGKAARRITESTGFPAATIHRTLGYRGYDGCPEGEWEYCRENSLPCDCVIVDEMSMVDTALFYRLLQAIDLRYTSLVMVGDAQQLPPVGAGQPFKDMIAQGAKNKLSISILAETIRQAGTLKINSTAILGGYMEPTEPGNNGERRAWYVFDGRIPNTKFNSSNQEDIVQFLEVCFTDLLDAAPFNYELLRDVQLLSPMRRGMIGTEKLNRVIQRVIQRKLYDRELPACEAGTNSPGGNKSARIYPGDKVIYTRNNKELDVFNGTLGIVKECAADFKGKNSSLVILFEDGISREIKGKNIRDVELAYALTVHKSQGSEFPCVITICHHSHYMGGKMLYRNLIYTAVTRAKETSIVIGDRKGIQWAMGRTGEAAGIERRTWWSAVQMPTE